MGLTSWGARSELDSTVRRGGPGPVHQSRSISGSLPATQDEATANLLTALSVVQSVWLSHGVDASHFGCIVGVAQPPASVMELSLRTPGLVFMPGSVKGVITKLAKPVGWLVALALRTPLGASRTAAQIVKSLRERAAAQSVVRPPVPDIATVTPAHLKGAPGIVVLVHGLLSTDVGTFDALVTRLRRSLPSTAIVGFPHNTLTSVRNNAQDLGNHLKRLLLSDSDSDQLPAVLACHSRGGLVARATFIYLLKAGGVRKVTPKGYATFGTPHLGAGLADAPEELVASFVSLATLKGTGQFARLLDVLSYLSFGGKLEGIEDLRAKDGSGSSQGRLLSELPEEENEYEDELEKIPLFLVGGNAPEGGRSGKLAKRIFQSTPNDRVVALDSSRWQTRPWSAERVTSAVDHFGYFGAADESLASLDAAVKRIAGWLGLSVP